MAAPNGENPEGVDFDAAAAEVEQSRLLEELDRDGELEQLRHLLAQEPVRDLLWRVLEHCHLYSTVFNSNFGNMTLAEGKRQVGLWLLSEICEADPEAEMRMRRKANAIAHARLMREREARARRRRPTSTTP